MSDATVAGNEPAFPRSTPLGAHGVNKRDYFAAIAMQGCIADSENASSPLEIAEWSFIMANCMVDKSEAQTREATSEKDAAEGCVDDLLKLAGDVAEHFKDTDAPLGVRARAILARIEPPEGPVPDAR